MNLVFASGNSPFVEACSSNIMMVYSGECRQEAYALLCSQEHLFMPIVENILYSSRLSITLQGSFGWSEN